MSGRVDVGKVARVLAVTAVDVVNALKRQGHTVRLRRINNTPVPLQTGPFQDHPHSHEENTGLSFLLKCNIGNLCCIKTTYANLLRSKTGSYVIMHCVRLVLYGH